MKTFSRIALLSLALILFANLVLAQEGPDNARLFDTYGALNSEDISARLDNYLIELRTDETYTGYVIGYGPEGDGSGTGKYLLRAIKQYVVKLRGYDSDRIQFIYGGRAKDPLSVSTELYLLAPGARPPVPRIFISSLPTIRAIRGKYFEYAGWEEDQSDSSGGIEYGNVTFAGVADIMRHQPDTVAYFVAYSYELATPGAWRRIARRDAEDLAGRGLASDRVNIIYGGRRRSADDESSTAYLELWLLPKGAPPPAKPAEPEASPREAVRLGSHYQFELADPKSDGSTSRSFADFLLADPLMNACLILHPDPGGDDPASWVATLPKVDLAALVQRWKAELQSKHGIAENRVTVIVGPSEEAGGSIDVWVLPADAPLPNPFAEEPAAEDPDIADSDDN